MTGDQILETILASTFSKADFNRRMRLLREFLEQKFFTPGEKKDLEHFLADRNVPAQEQAEITGWGNSVFESFTKDNAYDLLDMMTQKAKTLPALNMYVPAEPDNDLSMKVGQWVRQNVDKNALVEFHVDISSLGGCAFAWQGTFYDYTLTHYMHAKTDEIRTILDTFITK